MRIRRRFRLPHRGPHPPTTSLRSRLEAVRRELAALADSPGEAGSPGADLEACGPLTLVEIGGRERLATLERRGDGRRVVGAILRNGIIARGIADGRALRRRLTGD